MHMIGHQTIGADSNILHLTPLFEQAKKNIIIVSLDTLEF